MTKQLSSLSYFSTKYRPLGSSIIIKKTQETTLGF